MTYREKYHEEHPDKDADLAHIYGCPHYPGTGLLVECVPLDESCRACWDREMEEVTEDGKETLPR